MNKLARVAKRVRNVFRKNLWRTLLVTDEVTIDDVSDYASAEDFYELYNRVTWVFLAVNTNALASAQIPFKLRIKGTSDNIVTVDDHPIIKLLERPNKKSTQIRFFWRVYSFLYLTGNAFIELKGENNKIESMEVIRPDRVSVQELSDGTTKFLVREPNKTEPREVPYERMVHIPTFNPDSTLLGTGQLSPAADSAIIELYLRKYDKTYFESAERPKQVIECPDGMYLDEQTFKRLRNELRALHRGVDKFHRTALLEAGMKLRELQNPSHADTDFINHKRLVREELLASFGCWPLVVMLKESANRALLSQAYRMFYDLTIFPLAEVVRQELNVELVPRLDKTGLLELVYQYQMLKALRDDLLDISSAAYRLVQLGIMVPNEVRRHLLNMPNGVPWGDQPPKTALYQMPSSMFEPNADKEVMESDVNRHRSRTIEEHFVEASGLDDEIDRLLRELNV